MKFMDILENRSFRALCIPIRVAFCSSHWRDQHPGVPFWTLEDGLAKITKIYNTQSDAATQRAYLEALNKLLTAISKADQRLLVQADDVAEYTRLLNEYGSVVAGMFLGYSAAMHTFVTPAQVASFTGDAESTWRNRAARHEIPGARKAGKQWLLPKDVLDISYGVSMPDELRETTPEDEEIAENEQEIAADMATMTDEERHNTDS